MSRKEIKDKVLAKNENFTSDILDKNSNSLNKTDNQSILERLSALESLFNTVKNDNDILKNQLIKKDSYILDLEAKLQSYKSSINHLQSLLFGKKSEKLKNTSDETPLFDAMNCAVESIEDENSSQEQNISEQDKPTQNNQATSTSSKKKD